MRAEVVSIGTELLLGQIVDSNSAWIGEQLALSGIDCNYQTKVGDNVGRIVQVLRAALARSAWASRGVRTSTMDFLSSSSQALMNTNRPLMSTVRGTRWPDLCQSLAASLSRKLFGRMSGQFCSM